MTTYETDLEKPVRSRAKEDAREVSCEPKPGPVELESAIGNKEPEDPGLDEPQKARMRAMCIDPIRSAAGKLAAGGKADVRSVIMHLQPVVTAQNGFSAKGGTRATIQSAAERLMFDIKDSLSAIANELGGISDGEVEDEPEPDESDEPEEEPEAAADEEEEPETRPRRPVPAP
jgi:hypothetical protein